MPLWATPGGRLATMSNAWNEIPRNIGDRRGEGRALTNLGNAYAELGEIQQALVFNDN